MDSNSAVKKDDIGIIGFAIGGHNSFLYVTTNPKLKAAVIYYGSAPPDDKLARIQCPVLEIVGDKDARFAPAVPVLQEKMKELGKSYEWKIYPGADHDFFDDSESATMRQPRRNPGRSSSISLNGISVRRSQRLNQ